MTFTEIAANALGLNAMFFEDLFMGNLHWAFIFYAVGNLFTGGKAPLLRGIMFYLIVVTSMNMFMVTGFTIFTVAGIGLLYFLRVPALLFLENTADMAKHIPLAWVLTFYIVIAASAF